MRLQRYISQSGRASRREAERMMLAGRVTVNGTVVTQMGVRIDPSSDKVSVDGEPIRSSPVRWVAFHKPAGVLTTRADPHGGVTIYDRLPSQLSELRYVGRLDKDAEGLLLLTNDGQLSNALAHPRGEIEREYWLRVAGTLEPATINRLTSGIELDDGFARAVRARLIDSDKVSSTLKLVVTEGRKREVRRLLSAVGHPVMRLRRIRYGPLALGALKKGSWRDLDDDEVAALASAPRRGRGSESQ